MKMKSLIPGMLILICAVAIAATPRPQLKLAPVVAANFTSAGASVTIKNFQFTPKTVTVRVGAVVTWRNTEGTHTVTADDGSFTSPNLAAGKTYSHKFAKAGTYPYYCQFHGSKGGGDMSGVVVVK